MPVERPPSEDPVPETALLDKVFDEALELTAAVRNFVAFVGSQDRDDFSDKERSDYTRATSHLTARLLEIVAWAAANKAVFVGELSAEEAASDAYRISDWKVEWSDPELVSILDSRLQELIKQAHGLHERTKRLAS